MNEFDARWKRTVERAREATRPDEAAPFGFANRVLASVAAPSLSWEGLWQRVAWRAFAGVALALIVCASLEGPHLRDRKPLDPGIENTVARLVWSL